MENKFVSRCIRFIKGEDPNMENKQAVIHNTQWKETKQSSEQKLVTFSVPIEQSTEQGKDFLIKGVAINSTLTRNGVEFVPEELITSAASLRNKPILKDHTNSVDSIVGRTTQNVSFNSVNSNVDFEAKIMDEPTKEKIRDGRIQSVSVGAMVADLDQAFDSDGEPTHLIARGIDFVELSLVAVPADPNAGLAQAIQMSFNSQQKINTEKKDINKKMVKETKKAEVEETSNKTSTDSINQEVLSALKSISERLETLETVKAEKVDSKIEEEKAEVEKAVDETKGEVGNSEVEESVDEYENFNLGRSGKGFSLSMNAYPSNLKKLNRGNE